VGVFTFIPGLLLVQFFRHIHSRHEQISPLRQTLEMMTKQKINSKTGPSKKRRFTFPWWFIYMGYGCSLLLVSISILFIFARGIEFGELKIQKWLTSVLTTFFASILILEPLKVNI
jgi:hypothetical protein